jgi:hypothetical protein
MNEIEPSLQHLNMTTCLLPIEYVFVDNNSARLEMAGKAKGE